LIELERIYQEYVRAREECNQLERRAGEDEPESLKALDEARAKVAEKKRAYDRLIRGLRGGCHL
jgi:hypothetical protein